MSRSPLIAALIASLVLSAPSAAIARTHHRPLPHCKAGTARRHVWGRHHHKRFWECVKVGKKQPAGTATSTTASPTTPVPKVSYAAKVDPSFTQSPTDPLAVTYSYSADATSTLNGVSTDLAQAGQLPAGVLDFYSATSPGGPEQLYCSMNVGASVTGGNCPITYRSTGTYSTTTEYIPNSASAVTETDLETINPYSTTTSLPYQTTPLAGGPNTQTSYTPAVTDQNGNPVTDENGNTDTFGSGAIELVIVDTTTGQQIGILQDPDFIGQPLEFTGPTYNASSTICVLGDPGNCTAPASPSDSFSVQALYTPGSGSGWARSSSASEPLLFSS